MSDIEWTRNPDGSKGKAWNPVTGCTKVSQGCKHCYAEGIANRRLPHGGFTDRPFTEVRCHPERLDIPLRWRKPQRVFVNSMSDLFHEDVPDSFIDQVFAVMALCPQHTFQVLTKRPERMREYASKLRERSLEVAQRAVWLGIWDDPEAAAADTVSALDAGFAPNVWLGVSVEDQATADERIPLLLETPAAVRWVSAEPLLEEVTIFSLDGPVDVPDGAGSPLHWVVVGGESGPGARPFGLPWATHLVDQCRAVGAACFVKQLGARPTYADDDARLDDEGWPEHVKWGRNGCLTLRDRKGGDPSEWPADLRVREWPEVRS